jgi:hypothetical protein
MQVAGWDLSISRRAPPQTCEVANVSGGSLRILWPLLLLLVVTISCGEDDSSGTNWGGTYRVPDEFGEGSGTVSFVVESNDEIFCFKFSGAQSSYSTACNNPAADGFPFNGTQFSIPVLVRAAPAFVGRHATQICSPAIPNGTSRRVLVRLPGSSITTAAPQAFLAEMQHDAQRNLETASFLVRKGTDVKTVQKMLRHSDVSTTLGIYAQSMSEDRLAA